ncbi:NUDIX domain-containing protein [Plantactinospora solaniradicis]|uniref:NUDIX domain-containing protein n=1 Tax=Plantactinospora solaniradicis TaxID=1723736 RepID=A0ABW1KCC7_9ACTN
MSPPTHPVDVMLLLLHGDRVLLALRDGTGYADGQWNLPSGKLEAGEDARTAVIRETREEIGLHLDPAELRLATTVHHRSPAGQGRIALVFAASYDPHRHGEPVNAEPDKCAEIRWTPAHLLPSNTFPYSSAAVAAHRAGDAFRLDGWP